MGWSQQNPNEFPDVYMTRTIQPGDINMTHLAILYAICDMSEYIDTSPVVCNEWDGIVPSLLTDSGQCQLVAQSSQEVSHDSLESHPTITRGVSHWCITQAHNTVLYHNHRSWL